MTFGQYIENPMGKANAAFKISIWMVIVRTISLFLLLFLQIGMWGFVLSLTLSIFYSTYLHLKYLKRYL